jgi:hypothetical protein
MNAALDIVLGGVITILITIAVEYFRRPRLTLSVESPPADFLRRKKCPAVDARHLRLILHNNPLPAFLHWMERNPALQCRGEITFHHMDGQDVFGRSMTIRWASSPQPVATQIIDLDGQVRFRIQDRGRATVDTMDVFPGEEEILDVAARFDEEPECYGWNNDAYLFNWRNPNWKLPAGRYLVRIVIRSSGQKCYGKFRLINDVGRMDFRLERTTPEDTLNLRNRVYGKAA